MALKHVIVIKVCETFPLNDIQVKKRQPYNCSQNQEKNTILYLTFLKDIINTEFQIYEKKI